MESLEFKELMVGFNRALQRTKEQLLFAVDGDLNANDFKKAISAGKEKMKEYEAAVKKLAGEETKLRQFEDRYGKQIRAVRESLEKLA